MSLQQDNPSLTDPGTDPGTGGGLPDPSTGGGSPEPPRVVGLAVACDPLLGSVVTFTVNKAVSGTSCSTVLLDSDGNPIWSASFDPSINARAYRIVGTHDGTYYLEADNGLATKQVEVFINCGNLSTSDTLKLLVAHTDETAAGDDGTITLTPTGGTSPITLEVLVLSLNRATTSGTTQRFEGILPDTYDVRTTDSSTPPQVANSTVTVLPYMPGRAGCKDEYATNYDPLASTATSCDYAPRWRSAWGPAAAPVHVPALAGQTEAYVVAELLIGFRPGHPLAAFRPQGKPVQLKATIGPDGYATFRLGPYLRAVLGSADGAGGRRLDINTETADDLYCGYELRRAVSGELLDHGYVLNAAVPDAQLVDGRVLSSFARRPSWPGYDWKRMQLASRNAGRYGAIDEVHPDAVYLPCPSNPLPVAWLNPWGAWDFWVFQGRPQLGDEVGEGQLYNEASTGQRRYSEPGAAFETFKATSGVFRGDDLLKGLRTLWRSPQAWYQPQPGAEWVPIIVERGTRDVGRMGVARQEVAISFSVAAPEWAQGQ
jgi:hypothetical protein